MAQNLDRTFSRVFFVFVVVATDNVVVVVEADIVIVIVEVVVGNIVVVVELEL